MKILRAAEDYLEAMLMMQKRHGYIRSIDIAEFLGVTKPSVTYTTKRLKENGYITMDKDGLITLSESGMQIASSMGSGQHDFQSAACALCGHFPVAARYKGSGGFRAADSPGRIFSKRSEIAGH